MVLSNKKLKQKLREKLAESLISSFTGKVSNCDVSGEPDSESRPQSLKELFGAASRRGTRLTKREKRRESLISTVSDGNKQEEKKEDENRGLGETKREKKRKRDDVVKEKSAVDEMEEDDEKAQMLKRKKKNKKKNKKKKSNKMAKNAEEEKENQGDEKMNEVEAHVEVTHDNIGSAVNENVSTRVYDENVATRAYDENVATRAYDENVATKVYVGGIPYYSTEDDICSFFENCGTITEIDCMKFPESGKFRGIAILSFKTEAAAKRALAMDGADMGGLFLKVQPYKGTRTSKAVDFAPGIMEGYNRIYLGNLYWDVTEDDLKKLFANCNIASIRFGMDKETGEFRGYAHVDFSDSVSLKTALKLDQETIQGRPVKIRCAVPKKGTERGGAAVASAAETLPTSVSEMKEANTGFGFNTENGTIRRRTCYECGEKGHLSSDCPKKQVADYSVAVAGRGAAQTFPTLVPEMMEADNGFSAVSGKIKRRTCYECGEKGHLSSDCPNKQVADYSVAGGRGGAAAAETFPTYVTEMKEADTGLSAVSGKIKRRTCYECGEKGHLSSYCPKKQFVDYSVARGGGTAAIETFPTEMKEADTGLSAVSGKIKRRTCYECGEKGHLSSDCPKKQAADYLVAGGRATETLPTPVTETKVADTGLSAESGKIRRRTCYECGEKGHLSSNCPKKQVADSVSVVAETLPTPVPEIKEVGTGLSAVSGKIKRRTCYECGEKGHISSDCPKKQVADSVAS